MDGCRDIRHVAPRGVVGHGHAGRLDQVLAVHDHRALAVERRRIQLPVRGQAPAHRRQDVVDVVVRAEGELLEPAARTPDRGFVHSDGHDVELTALGGDVGRHALAQRPFLQRHPVDGDSRIGLLEMPGELLHLDHVAVVHGRNRQLAGEGCRPVRHRCGNCRNGQFHVLLHLILPESACLRTTELEGNKMRSLICFLILNVFFCVISVDFEKNRTCPATDRPSCIGVAGGKASAPGSAAEPANARSGSRRLPDTVPDAHHLPPHPCAHRQCGGGP